jgi:hypothetical protein
MLACLFCVVCVMQRRQGGRDLVFETAKRSSARQEMDTSKSGGGEIEAKANAHPEGNWPRLLDIIKALLRLKQALRRRATSA